MRPAGIVVALGVAQTLAWASSYYLPAILAEPIGRELGLSAGWVFGAFSVALLVSAAAGPYAGARIDRLGGRGVLMASSVLFAAGLALLGLADGPGLLFTAWLVLGLAMAAGLYDAAFSALATIYGLGARGPITGVTLLGGFASTVGWPISAALEAEFGWRLACFAWAGAHLVIALPLYALLPPPRAATPVTPAADEPPPAGMFSRPMLLLGFVFAATWFTSTAMGAHLPGLLIAAGASPGAALFAAGLVGPAQVAARLLEFGLLRRTHPLLSGRLAALAHLAGAGFFLLLGAPAAYLFTVLHGAGNGVMTIAKGTLPLALFGTVGYGARQGWLGGPARIGQAAAPLAFALLVERLGLYALGVTMALGLLSFLALLAVRRS